MRLFCLDGACTPRHGHAEATTRAILAQGLTSAFTRTACEETHDFFASQQELARAGTLGDLPLVLLVAGQSDGATADDWGARQAAVRGMCKLSTRCTLQVADHSGHHIPEEEPAAVARAFAHAVDAARHPAP